MTEALKRGMGFIVGGGIGFLAYRLIGCPSGGCPMTSNPYVSIIIFGLIGLSFVSGR